MASIIDIKKRINNINETKKIVKAMYLVSSIQMQKSKKTYVATKVFFDTIYNSIIDIIVNNEEIESSYFEAKDKDGKNLYIVLTSDNGLVGQYNQNITKNILDNIPNPENAILLVAGYMGKKILKNNVFSIDEEFESFINKPSLLRAEDIIKYAFEKYNSENINNIYVVYNDLVNTFTQDVKMIKLFPIDKKIFRSNSLNEQKRKEKQILYEPSIESVLDNLLTLYLNGVMYDLLVDAYISEQASRLVAMNNATKNAEKIISSLELEYNKKRQENITREINEIANNN